MTKVMSPFLILPTPLNKTHVAKVRLILKEERPLKMSQLAVAIQDNFVH